MHSTKTLTIVGYASGVAAANSHCTAGPAVLRHSPYLQALATDQLALSWQTTIEGNEAESADKMEAVLAQTSQLADQIYKLVSAGRYFTVFGGDHSCAIGTWSGVFQAMHKLGDLGLVWIDAHMDSHTPETSLTGNIHGMPVATLLGYGATCLTQIARNQPKIKPENLCLVGVRSYELAEQAFLKKLNVKVFYMDEVQTRGIDVIIKEAIEHVSQNTVKIGLSLDIDGIDPLDAPGTGCYTPGGIEGEALCQALTRFSQVPKLVGVEIVEFDPSRDRNHLTEKLIVRLVAAITGVET